MTRKHYWGIATLIILIIGTVILSITLLKKQDTEPSRVYNTPTAEVLDTLRHKQDTPTPKTADKPKPISETIQNNGHWHNGEWHETPHDTPTQPAQVTPAPIPTTDPNLNDWHNRYMSAIDNWQNTIKAHRNYSKGKFTPEHVKSLSNAEKQQIQSDLNKFKKQSEIALNKVNAIEKERYPLQNSR